MTDDTTPVETETPAETPAQEVDWKVEARKWEQRAKANTEAATRLAALEEADKTESQKLQDALAAKDRELSTLRIDSLRNRIAAEKGVPVRLISGESEEDMLAAAADALAWRPPTAAGVVPTAGKPAENAPASTIAAGRDLYASRRNKTKP